MKETWGVLELPAQCYVGGYCGGGMLRSIEFVGEGAICRVFLGYDLHSSFFFYIALCTLIAGYTLPTHHMDNKIIKVTSWNVNGLGSYKKRRKTLDYLKQKQSDVIMLQETHLLEKDAARICGRWISCSYHNCYNKKQRGVSILFSKSLDVRVDREFRDSKGRTLVLLVNLSGQMVILGNIYAPNEDDPDFFLNIKKILLDFGDFPVILGGDFNQPLDAFLDKSKPGSSRPSKTVNAINSFCRQNGLHDIWRLLNPTARDYTFFSNRHSVYSRIYYFLISHSLITNTGACSIGAIAISDHAPVDIVVTIGSETERTKTW